MGEEEKKDAEEPKAEGAETPAETPAEEAPAEEVTESAVGQPVKFAPLQGEEMGEGKENLDLILDVSTKITVELGRTKMLIKDVLNLNIGSVIEINKLAGEPVDVMVNNKLVAKGEVVVINENFGVRITEIVGAEQRIRKLGGE
ncbi:MAG: flagellar motor switch protein FliN [Candidatus Aureabacteria bacterium]|nr:flagellar motor switch protein FliN [Candidatus Auribacterota bacterium]